MADNTNDSDSKLITLGGLRTFYNNLKDALSGLFYTQSDANDTFAYKNGEGSEDFSCKTLTVGDAETESEGSVVIVSHEGYACEISCASTSFIFKHDYEQTGSVALRVPGYACEIMTGVRVNRGLPLGYDTIPRSAMPTVFASFVEDLSDTTLDSVFSNSTTKRGEFIALTKNWSEFGKGIYIITEYKSNAEVGESKYKCTLCAPFMNSAIYYCKSNSTFYIYSSATKEFVAVSTTTTITIEGDYEVATSEDINSVIETLNESQDEQGDVDDTEDPENTEEE